MQYNEERVEVGSISRAAFTKMIPFYVKKQSLRTCLCVHCFQGKLVMKSLVRNWPLFHRGETPGSPCDCSCNLCKDRGCANFLPVESEENVFGIGDLCEKLLCERVTIYRTDGGQDVSAHRNACIMGKCRECHAKMEKFRQCPKHKGVTGRAAVAGGEAHGGHHEECRWETFAYADDGGEDAGATPDTPHSHVRGSRRPVDDDTSDAEYTPRSDGGNRPRKVRIQ